MTDEKDLAARFDDPEKTHVLVRGDCEHIFPVPLARLEDGADFVCPVCGETDRLDEEALQVAKEDLDKLEATGPLNELGKLVSDFMSRRRSKN